MSRANNIWQGAAALALGLALAVIIVFAATIRQEDLRFDSEPVYTLDAPWQVEVNGQDVGTVTLPAQIKAKAGDNVEIRTLLPEEPTVCNSLMFHSTHQYVEIELDGTLLLRYGRDMKTPIPMSPGSPWQYTRLPNDWAGKQLTIRLVGYYDGYAGSVGTIYLGTKASLLYMVVKRAAFPLLLTVPVMVLGVFMVIASFFFHQRSAVRKIRYLGAFTVTTCLWILLESQITQLFTGRVLLCMNLIFILFSLLPLLIQHYLLSYQIFGRSRYMRAVYGLCFFAFLLIHAARFAGVLDYMDSVPLVHVLFVLIIGGVLYTLVGEKLRRRPLNEESCYLFVALLVFAAFALVDMARFYLAHAASSAIQFSHIGLCCFVIILGVSAAKQESTAQAERIEGLLLKRLAYTDTLTGLKNRTAFEERLEQYRTQGQGQDLIIMIADMDNLKGINDHAGHAAGDRAIVCMARRMVEAFSDVGTCYRIGGDEMCVLCEGLDAQAFESRMQAYCQQMRRQSVSGHVVDVSCGFAQRQGEDVDSLFVAADERMYAAKAQAKRRRETEAACS